MSDGGENNLKLLRQLTKRKNPHSKNKTAKKEDGKAKGGKAAEKAAEP